jgi:hypothetical protein
VAALGRDGAIAARRQRKMAASDPDIHDRGLSTPQLVLLVAGDSVVVEADCDEP